MFNEIYHFIALGVIALVSALVIILGLKKKKSKQKYERGGGLVTGMAIGMPLGIIYGAVINNLALGVAIGAGAGVAIGSAIEAKHDHGSKEVMGKSKKILILLVIITGILVFLSLLALFILGYN